MTTFIQNVQAVLNPVASGGAFYGINETEEPVYPYIVWQKVVSTDNVTFGGPTNVQNTRIQIDIFSRSVSEVESLEDGVRAAMLAASFTTVPVSSQYLYEAPVRAHRMSLDFSIWATN